MAITTKTASDVEGMRLACRLAAEVLDMLTPHVKAGITTLQLDKLSLDYVVNVQGCISATVGYAPPGYPPFPSSICTSVNHVVCHGIPGDKKLKAGDVVNIDVTVIKDGFHGDTSRMFYVGEPSIQAKRLCDLTYECMWQGIARIKPGTRLGDMGHAIQTHAETNGLSVVREFCGHGIGRRFHEVTVVLDMLSFGIIIPVLPKLVEEFLGGDTAQAAEIYGLMGTSWALMQFVCSPIQGALSDRFGRRRR